MTDENGSVTRLPPDGRSGGRALVTAKVLIVLVAFLVFAITATGWTATRWLDGRLGDVLALDPHSDAITDAEGQRGDENILLVGSDTRVGAQQGDDVGDTSMVDGARSDTVMVAHVPAGRSRAVIVSFPRDLQIRRPECTGWDPVSRSYTGRIDPGADVAKLNSAYQIGGPLCLTKVVQHLSGLAVTRFMAVDFQGFKGLVDAVGGVPVCVARPLEDAELGTIIPAPGRHRLSGDTALDYVRARHVTGDPTADYGRIIRQQRFLSALLREVLAPAVLLDPGRLRAVIETVTVNSFGENISTRALLTLAQSLNGLKPGEVTFVTVPTSGEANEYGNEELRLRDNAALFRAIIDGIPLPGEQQSDPPSGTASPDTGTTATTRPATASASTPAPGPPQVQVRVLNGARLPGAAGRAAESLRQAGFAVLGVGDAANEVTVTTIRYPPVREAEARRLLAGLPDAVLQPDQALAGAVVLVVGPDFDGADPSPADPSPADPSTAPPPSSPGPLSTVNGADTACG